MSNVTRCEWLQAKAWSDCYRGQVFKNFTPCRTETKNGSPYCMSCMPYMAVNLLGENHDSEIEKYVKEDSYSKFRLWSLNYSLKDDLKRSFDAITYENYNNGISPKTFCALGCKLPDNWFVHSLNHDVALIISKTESNQYVLEGLASVGTSIYIHQATPKQKEQFQSIINK